MVFGTILLALLVVVLGGSAALLSGVDPEADAIADRLVDEPDQQLLLARWLRRTRWARNVGGMAGLIWWLLATQGRGQLLVFGLGGVALGSMAAQLHQVRQGSGMRTASLEHRSVSGYATVATQRQLLIIAIGAVVLVVIALFAVVGTDRGEPSGRAPLWWAVAALAVLAVGAGLQRTVARRPRPALATGLRYADDLARILAIGRGLGEPTAFLAAAMLAVGFLAAESTIGWPAGIVALGLQMYAVVTWWQNRRLGLHHLVTERRRVEGGRATAS